MEPAPPFSRRDFLAASAGTLGASGLPGPHAREAHAADAEKLALDGGKKAVSGPVRNSSASGSPSGSGSTRSRGRTLCSTGKAPRPA
ncbi:MAG: twin-arginine translocation signal domain-containing protein [Isosphaeraceae bacterium]